MNESMKSVTASLLEHISDEPTSLAQLVEETGQSRSTLTRRLNDLITENKVQRIGKGRATRYIRVSESPEASESSASSTVLTPQSQRLVERLSAPENKREPVGYRRTLLESYRPNETEYLSKSTRTHLAELGRGSSANEPAGTYARKILDRLLIDLSWNSSRLEGNTYSLLETERLLSEDRIATERLGFETQMILNHKAAIEFLVDGAPDIALTPYVVKSLHAILSENLLADASAGGRLRTTSVGIHGSVFYPLDNPHQLAELFEQLLLKAEAIEDPFEQSFFTLVHLPYLQPFLDVNKRVSRLAANIPFIRKNLSPLSFIDVDQETYIQGLLGVYELNDVSILRDVFVNAYARSAARYAAVRESLGEPDLFRLKYRNEIKKIVADIIRQTMTPKNATAAIRESAKAIPVSEQAQFISVVQSELNTLHEGNFARFRVTPAEFAAWKNAKDR